MQLYIWHGSGSGYQLYEAAETDGANRLQQIWHITLPGIRGIVRTYDGIKPWQHLNGSFDQVFNLYTKAVYESGDILDTFIYRLGLIDAVMEPLQRWDYSNRLFRPSSFPHHITWRISLITVFLMGY